MLKSKALRIHQRQTQREILNEVHKIFQMAPKGFDAIILVVKYGDRFTGEDQQALDLLQAFLGKESTKRMILILTKGDQALFHAENESTTQEEHIKKWISELPEWMQAFIKEINHRWVLFNNHIKEAENPEACKKQLSELIEVNLNLYLKIDHFEITQGAGKSFKFKPIDKLTPSLERSR